MINFFDTSFYDKESSKYSGKRYGTSPRSYSQFFFQERLKHVVALVGKHVRGKTGQVLIEDGCADGVVAQAVYKRYPQVFSKVIGTDISPGMIEEAKNLNKIPELSFFVKRELPFEIKANIILAVGFVSPGIFEDEFSFIRDHLAVSGIIIVSLVAGNSLHAHFKLKDKEIAQDYLSFKEYETFLRKDYVILDAVPYGFFIPKLWAWPVLGRILQPIFEIVGRIFPALFHETLYVIKKKG